MAEKKVETTDISVEERLKKMNPEKALEVLEKHLIGGQVISNYTISAELK